MRNRYLTATTEGRRLYGSLKNDNASDEAQDFISKAIKKHVDEGMSQDQAAAVAYKEAREEGYKVPANENSKCPICKDEMSDHSSEGTCGVCGEQCG